MDLKDFQDVSHDDEVPAKLTATGGGKKKKEKVELVDSEFHSESDRIIKDLEARIAAINAPVSKKVGKTSEQVEEVVQDAAPVAIEDPTDDDTETLYVQEGEGDSLLTKIQPFIIPIFLTIFALIFAAIFMYFFSKSKVERSAQAIVNNQTQPEVIIIREDKPKVEQVVVVPTTPECNEETQVLNKEKNECEDLPPPPPPPEKAKFENGTTTIVKVTFSYDRQSYDTFPRGIYLLADQIFGEEDEYDGYKLLAVNRPDANDTFFGIDRYMVSLIGACRYVVDEAQVLVSDMNTSEGDEVYSAITNKYFRGKVVKVISSSKPHIVCGK